MAQLYLDLDELDRRVRGRWLWSVGRRNLAEFRRSDYLGPSRGAARTRPCATASQQRDRPASGGPIRLLTHLRYAGYSLQPGQLLLLLTDADAHAGLHRRRDHQHALARAPCLRAASADRRARARRALQLGLPKTFHVSPFMPMQRDYAWRFTVRAGALRVHMDVLRDGDASSMRPWRCSAGRWMRRSLRRVLLRYPLMTRRWSARSTGRRCDCG